MTMRRPDVRFRLTDAEKSEVKEEVRDLLIQLARTRQIVTYSDFVMMLQTVHLHPHSFIFAHLLRQVCGEEEEKGSGVLCALVVSKATGIPGAGYFRRGDVQDTEMDPDDLEGRWRADVEAVFARWAE